MMPMLAAEPASGQCSNAPSDDVGRCTERHTHVDNQAESQQGMDRGVEETMPDRGVEETMPNPPSWELGLGL